AQALDLEPVGAVPEAALVEGPPPEPGPAEDSAAALAIAPEDANPLDDEPDDEAPVDEAAVNQTQDTPPAPAALAEPAETDEPAERIGGGPPAHLIPPAPPGPVFEHLPQVWVLELSSFQLDGVEGFEPTAAAVLNVTQDHLDWHGSMAAYAAAKARIHGRQAVMVVNRDDPLVEAMVPPPQVIAGKGRGKSGRSRTIHRSVLRFGMQAPTRPGDFGLVETGGMTWLVRARPADEVEPGTEGLQIQRLMPADALRVRGRHNAANALAALALATAAGLPLAPMLHGLRDYAGEPHRVEHLGRIAEVDAYDDSKGTNVGATVAAIAGLGADKAPSRLVLILGGDGKGQDFAPLAAPVARHARAVALIGRDAAAIEAVLQDGGVTVQRHDTLEAATRWCFGQAQAGDAVLLSPACASLDMFRNYAHRAQVFADTVRALALERGEIVA
ncbi:MAG TPA: UDP-N-acetylmuramoyl-L-alanine--D-glutamate ligase, partial [Burkholderiaceae bacterium]|nr:UDP-N-acetylmuramoyl-L-alanine--D-glutamate ligase [Burkholderiaceae bacterium]